MESGDLAPFQSIEGGMRFSLRKAHFTLPFVLLLLLGGALASGLLAPPLQAFPHGQPRVISSRATGDFPGSVSFSLQVEHRVPITEIRLYHQLERDACSPLSSWAYPEFVPGEQVDATWSWDLRRSGGLPPGTRVHYWWVLTDAQGNTFETARYLFEFADNRHSWQELSAGRLTFFWHRGDRGFGQAMLEVGQQALEGLQQDIGVNLDRQVRVYAYPDAASLQEALL
ncbi:MAG: hypothetical protein ACE5IG_03155, partial [Dehalococcoidia bacterium]